MEVETDFEVSPEDEEAFRLELEALGDASCSETESEDDDADLVVVGASDSSSEDEDEDDALAEGRVVATDTDFGASLNDLRNLFKKRDEKLHDYEDVLTTLSENIRDSTAKLKRPDSAADAEEAGKENVRAPTTSDHALSEEIADEAAKRDEAARKFRLMEQERERHREKQRQELERRSEAERLKREEESRLEMARLEAESKARLAAIEESFKREEMKLQLELEQERIEQERLDKEARDRMESLRALQEEEERREEQRKRRVETQRIERRNVALIGLRDKQAARVIQKHYFAFRGKVRAAITLQTYARRKNAVARVREMRGLRNRAICIQKHFRAFLACRLLDRNKRAVCIQKHFRAHAAKTLFQRSMQSLVIIQAFSRMHRERSKFSQVVGSARTIQSYYRMTVDRDHFRRCVRAAKVIGIAWRRHASAKQTSEEMLARATEVASEWSLQQMRHLATVMQETGQYSSSLRKILQDGLQRRCQDLTSRLLTSTRRAADLVRAGKAPNLPLAKAQDRAEAQSLGLVRLVRLVDGAQTLVGSFVDFLHRCATSTHRLKRSVGKIGQKSAKLEDHAYSWTMEEMSEGNLESSQGIYWLQAHLMMSLRQGKLLLDYQPKQEKQEVQPLAQNLVSQYQQPIGLGLEAKKNDLTDDMLAMNSPGSEVDEIRDLDLSLEGLTSMKQIRRCKNLRKLCLNSNSILSLEGIQGCTLLEDLSMKGNALTSAGELKALQRLVSLQLDGNALSSVDCIRSMRALRDLSADDNRIEEFVSGAACRMTMTNLSLAGNRVKALGSIGDLVELQSLSLSRNQLQDFDGIERCGKLRVLNLSNNYIVSVPCIRKMNALAHLTELRLSRNRLTSFPFACVSLPNLRSLHLDENRISKVEPVLGCPLLEKLELAFNDIDDLGAISSLSSCLRLQFLNLAENPVVAKEGFGERIKRMLPSLRELNNEDVENSKRCFQSGTSLLKWKCLQRLNPDLHAQSKMRSQMQSFLSNHTILGAHAPIVASYAEVGDRGSGTWRSAIESQWKESTRVACRLGNKTCEDPVTHQNVFVADSGFRSERDDLFNRKASLIQCRWRTYASKRRTYRESSEGREKGARAIQKAWKSHKLRHSPASIRARKTLDALKRERALKLDQSRHAAAERIQASWKAHKVRSYLARARENAKYVEEDEFDLEEFDFEADDDFLRSFDEEADNFLSSVVLPSPAAVPARSPVRLGARHGAWQDEAGPSRVRSFGRQSEAVEEEEETRASPAAVAEAGPSTSAWPGAGETPKRPTPLRAEASAAESVLSQGYSKASLSPGRSRLDAGESTLSVHEEKQKAKMEKIANEWGFSSQATARMFMKKRNKMVKQQKKRKKQEKLRDPSVRYQKFKQVTDKHEPLLRSPPLHHRNGKALSLARTSLYGPASRQGSRKPEASPTAEHSATSGSATKAKARVAQRRQPAGGGGRNRASARGGNVARDYGDHRDDNSVSTISIGSEENQVDAHAIAMAYLQEGTSASSIKINNWSL